MIKAVLDTNVLVSATFWTGDSFRIVNLIDQKKIISLLSKEIIAEYEQTIRSDEIIEKVENKGLVLSQAVQKIIINSRIIEPTIKLEVVKEDPDDNKIVDCAAAGDADFIITNDEHLLKLKAYGKIKIVKPLEFINKFEKGEYK